VHATITFKKYLYRYRIHFFSYAGLCGVVDAMSAQGSRARALLHIPEPPFVVHDDGGADEARSDAKGMPFAGLRCLLYRLLGAIVWLSLGCGALVCLNLIVGRALRASERPRFLIVNVKVVSYISLQYRYPFHL
jgi:hypothetical protein